MSLLDAAAKAGIRAAIMSVTDTFMVTPVIYELRGESIDRWNEDRGDQAITTYNFNALAEYPDEKKDEVRRTANVAAFNQGDIHLSMNLETLDALGYIDSAKNFKGTLEKDYFTVAGIRYRVIYIGYDGPLDEKNVLVKLYGERTEKKS